MNPKFFVNFVACGLTFLSLYCSYYLYVRYGFTFNNLSIEIKLYYAILIIGVLLTLLIIFVKSKTAYNIILVLLSFIFSLYTINYFLFYFNFIQPPHLNTKFLNAAKEQNIAYDKRNKYEVLIDMRLNEADVWPVVYPKIWLDKGPLKVGSEELFPFASVSNSKLVHCNESGSWTSYISDKYGFNNNSNVYQDEIDVALIGDSFTEGACVDRSLNIASSLANNSLKVVNFGKGGSGSLMEYAIMKEYALPLKPKNIVWIFYENDISETIVESNNTFLRKYVETNYLQNLLNLQPSIDSSLKKYINRDISLKGDNNFKQFLRLWHIRYFIKKILVEEELEIINFDKGERLVFDLIVKAAQEVNNEGGKFTFVYLPSRETLINSNIPKHIIRLINKLKDKKISIINMQNIIIRSKEPIESLFYFGIQNHYNEFGYKLVSDAIFNKIK
jgi:hypothetical protein